MRTADLVLRTLLLEFLPFIVLIGTLYVVAGGIYVRGNRNGGPLANTGMLAIGGAMTPLGDPLLFLGFFKGVDFFRTLRHMCLPMLLVLAILLALYFAPDSALYMRDVAQAVKGDPTPVSALHIERVSTFCSRSCWGLC